MTEPRGARLPQSFFDRDCLEVARDLLGRHLRKGGVELRITEVEAYRGPTDTASHSTAGVTARTEPMFGPPGHAYVYLIYGLHQMLNLVARPAGAAVLIRAAEPMAGLETIRARRGGKVGPVLLTGPGKVGQALAIDRSFSGHPLYEPGGLEVLAGAPVEAWLEGPRVGIDYAEPHDRDAPWRLAVPGTRWVSQRRTLRPPGQAGPPGPPG